MITLWHNPRCSKSRAALALLQGRDDVTIRLYLTDPPSEAEIRAALAQLNLPAIALMRTGEATFKTLGLTKTSEGDSLIAAMAAHPILIERPVAFSAKGARIGRPPEAILDIL